MSVRVSVPRVEVKTIAIPFASWKSRRVDAHHPRVKKPSEVFFTRRRKRKDTYAPFSGALLRAYAFQSRKTANANVGKKVPRETRASSTHLVPPLGVIPVLVPEVQRLDILRRLVRHRER